MSTELVQQSSERQTSVAETAVSAKQGQCCSLMYLACVLREEERERERETDRQQRERAREETERQRDGEGGKEGGRERGKQGGREGEKEKEPSEPGLCSDRKSERERVTYLGAEAEVSVLRHVTQHGDELAGTAAQERAEARHVLLLHLNTDRDMGAHSTQRKNKYTSSA